eukprot:TRINITY_DN10399_c0_g1_i1.p1 TRINITY_DN10399_c0_g1~~TRINITY_DN10399_c0_g1_i1.p1  ORF type:complete len:817 (+),score=120.68 TRINITY_DN10399_c0_g1_i1:138-2588(+)
MALSGIALLKTWPVTVSKERKCSRLRQRVAGSYKLGNTHSVLSLGALGLLAGMRRWRMCKNNQERYILQALPKSSLNNGLLIDAASQYCEHFSRLLQYERSEDLQQHIRQLRPKKGGHSCRALQARVLDRDAFLVRFTTGTDRSQTIKLQSYLKNSACVAISRDDLGGLLGDESNEFPEFFIAHVVKGFGHEGHTSVDVEIESVAKLTKERNFDILGDLQADKEMNTKAELGIQCSQDDIHDRLEQFIPSCTWRMDVWYSEISFQRMAESLKLLHDRVLQGRKHKKKPKERKRVEKKYAVQNIMLESFSHYKHVLQAATAPCVSWEGSAAELDPQPVFAAAVTSLFKGSTTRKGVNDFLGRFCKDHMLNAAQQACLRNSLTSRISLIQGPPGTGKSFTACHILRALLEFEGCVLDHPARILACAFSNAATDVLLEQLVALGVKTVRLGVTRNIALDKYGLHKCMKQHPDITSAKDRLLTAIESLKEAHEGRLEKEQLRHHYMEFSEAKAHLQETRLKVKRSILENAEVVVATCIGAGDPVLDGLSFRTVLLDEATQATEPAVLVPLMRCPQRCILLGDQNQLPPTVISSAASNGGLSISLFVRLLHSGAKARMLEEQYRMHPYIASFVSQQFYGGRLISHSSAPLLPPPGGFKWPENRPIALVDASTERGEEYVEQQIGFSWVNKAEADEVVQQVENLVHMKDIAPSEIGVLSPYHAQVKLIQELLSRSALDGCLLVDVRTVDGFQGAERDVILLSLVRANARKQLGFLKDWRRLNVAVTRARRGLIVFASRSMLECDEHWAAFLNHIDQSQTSVW